MTNQFASIKPWQLQSELQRQMRHGNRGNLTAAVKRLDEKGLVLLHPTSKKAHITSKGMAEVETRRLLDST